MRGVAAVEKALRHAKATSAVALAASSATGARLLKGELLIVFRKPRGLAFYRLAEKASAARRLLRELEGQAGERSAAGGLSGGERRALEDGGLSFEALLEGEVDPIARGQAEYAKLLGRALSTKRAARLLAVNESRVRQRLLAKPPTLYGLRAKKEWKLPAFQFTKGGLVPGIEQVVPHIPAGASLLTIDRWFRMPNADLPADEEGQSELTPLEWLSLGKPPAEVAELVLEL
ncbi:MAG: hypothetical protein HYZ28_07240 [Myxococcales bacterium]|nr:hypothetical protein [Myxococcales bacterium]